MSDSRSVERVSVSSGSRDKRDNRQKGPTGKGKHQKDKKQQSELKKQERLRKQEEKRRSDISFHSQTEQAFSDLPADIRVDITWVLRQLKLAEPWKELVDWHSSLDENRANILEQWIELKNAKCTPQRKERKQTPAPTPEQIKEYMNQQPKYSEEEIKALKTWIDANCTAKQMSDL